MVWTVQPPALHDYASNTMLLFTSFLLLSCVGAAVAIGGAMPPDPSVHWPGHSWIHFMKRLHVIMSIGCFLMNLCACFFSVFALHRTLAGGFDTRATSATEVIVRELEFEYVAVSAYFFAGTMLLMGPVGIRCFCMVQQGLRSDTLAASVMCLIVGVVLLILSFFNQHLVQFPFVSYGQVVHRFMELSFEHCFAGDKPALIMLLAWTLQCVSAVLAICSLIETVPWIYYRDFHQDESVPSVDEADDGLPASAEQLQRQRLARIQHTQQIQRGGRLHRLSPRGSQEDIAAGASANGCGNSGGPAAGPAAMSHVGATGRASPLGPSQLSPSCIPQPGVVVGIAPFNAGASLCSGAGCLGHGGHSAGSPAMHPASHGMAVSLGHLGSGCSMYGEALHSIIEPQTPGREDGFPVTPPKNDCGNGRPFASSAHTAGNGAGAGPSLQMAGLSARARPPAPVDVGAASSSAAGAQGVSAVPLWQRALDHPALSVSRPIGNGSASKPLPSSRGAYRRANSVASSINSLDSLVVD